MLAESFLSMKKTLCAISEAVSVLLLLPSSQHHICQVVQRFNAQEAAEWISSRYQAHIFQVPRGILQKTYVTGCYGGVRKAETVIALEVMQNEVHEDHHGIKHCTHLYTAAGALRQSLV